MTPAGPAAVVTGIGLVTPLGRKVDEFFDAACAGRSGVVRPPEGHPAAGWLAAAGIAPQIDPAEVLAPTEARCLDRFVLLALAAADDALADAQLVVGQDVDPWRTAVVVGTGGGGLQTFEQHALARSSRGRAAVSAYLLPGMLSNMAAARIAIKHGAQGHSSAPVTACAAGAQAIAEALWLIRAGAADVVICGGTESPLHPTIASTFTNAHALARGFTEPAEASRPFDRRRAGFVLAEGAAVLVLERAGHADARGATGYAELAGWGGTTDAYHPVMPRADGAGAAECMRRALTDAGVAAADVGYLNAHGTSTRLGDLAEARAVRAVFGGESGDGGPAVSSIKGTTGHMLAASGAVEAAVTVLSVARGLLPPTHNLDDPDPGCELDHVRGTARAGAPAAAVSNSFAFGGHNVSLVFRPASTRLRAPAAELEEV